MTKFEEELINQLKEMNLNLKLLSKKLDNIDSSICCAVNNEGITDYINQLKDTLIR